MDWGNERYVRLYTRDTGDMLAIGWEGRAVLAELLRKVDRAGVLDESDGAIVCEMLRIPIEIVEVALPRMASRGVIEIVDGQIILPNFIDAQEAKSSDKQRQAESRARRRDKARAGNRTEPSRAVTEESRSTVTDSHEPSHDVTPSLAVQCLAVPSQTLDGGHELTLVVERPSGNSDPVCIVTADFNRLFERRIQPTTYREIALKAFKAGYSVALVKAAQWGAYQRCKASPEVLKNFTPKTVWRLKSRDSKTTLPEWLDIAEQEWRDQHGGKPMPWRQAS